MALNDNSIIGLVNRFTAKVIGESEYDLGSWYKIDGLDVTWDVADTRVGDQGNYRWIMPANTKYSAVKLSRAANKTDAEKVRKWLNKTQFDHKVGTNVVIHLYDSNRSEPGEGFIWELRNVLPAKWSISSFDANGSAVAVELLELQHEGFLEEGPMLGA